MIGRSEMQEGRQNEERGDGRTMKRRQSEGGELSVGGGETGAGRVIKWRSEKRVVKRRRGAERMIKLRE